jgi:hypothetical protein
MCFFMILSLYPLRLAKPPQGSIIKSPGAGTNDWLHLRWDVTRQHNAVVQITTKAGGWLDLLSSAGTCHDGEATALPHVPSC